MRSWPPQSMRLCIQPHGTGQTGATMRVTGQVSCWRSEGLSTTPAGLKAEASSARLSTVLVVGKHDRRSPQGVGVKRQRAYESCCRCISFSAHHARKPSLPRARLSHPPTRCSAWIRSTDISACAPAAVAAVHRAADILSVLRGRHAPRRNCSARYTFSIAREHSAKGRGVPQLLRFKPALTRLCERAGATRALMYHR